MKKTMLVRFAPVFAGMALIAMMFVAPAQTGQERRLPPGQICMNHAPRANQPNMKECHCDYVCETDIDTGKDTGDYHAGYGCLNYCDAAVKQCTCHPEEPCPKPQGASSGNVWPGHVHQGYVDKYGDPFK